MAWGLTRSNHTGVDCDHIAAIDNVARKLSAARRPAALVGLWFSLGHSTVVVLLCAAVSMGSAYARAHIASLATAGANVGDAVSKPNPKRNPTGYIFHALSTRPSTYRQQAQPTRQPAASTLTCSPSSSSDAAWACSGPWPWSPARPRLAVLHARYCGPTAARLIAPMMMSVIEDTTSPTFAPAVANDATCVEINQCVGCRPGSVERRGTSTTTPSSRRRVDGVEDDAP